MTVLKGKIALVTGASGGIGRAISIKLCQEGAHVLLHGRNIELLQKINEEIKSFGGNSTIIIADLSKPQDIYNMFREIAKKFKRLDVIINNAGIGIYGNPIDCTIENFNKLIDINLKSVFIVCKEALNLMIPEKKGYIINISSILGIQIPPGCENQTVYAASKHGVMGLTKGISIQAHEYGIKVSAILPGGTDTKMAHSAWPDPKERPIFIKPEDIANTVIYLLTLSDRAVVDQVVVRRVSGNPIF